MNNIDYGRKIFLSANMMEGKTNTNDLFYDLSEYLNELFPEISNEKEREMLLKNISSYYDTLNALLVKHTIEHPCKSKS